MNDLVGRPKPKISAAEMQVRLEAVQQADANYRIEGQFSSPEADAIFGFSLILCGTLLLDEDRQLAVL